MESIQEPLYDLIFFSLFNDVDNKYPNRLNKIVCNNLQPDSVCYFIINKYILEKEYIKGLERCYTTHYGCLLNKLDIILLLEKQKIQILNWMLEKSKKDENLKEKFDNIKLNKLITQALMSKKTLIWAFDNKYITTHNMLFNVLEMILISMDENTIINILNTLYELKNEYEIINKVFDYVDVLLRVLVERPNDECNNCIYWFWEHRNEIIFRYDEDIMYGAFQSAKIEIIEFLWKNKDEIGYFKYHKNDIISGVLQAIYYNGDDDDLVLWFKDNMHIFDINDNDINYDDVDNINM